MRFARGAERNRNRGPAAFAVVHDELARVGRAGLEAGDGAGDGAGGRDRPEVVGVRERAALAPGEEQVRRQGVPAERVDREIEVEAARRRFGRLEGNDGIGRFEGGGEHADDHDAAAALAAAVGLERRIDARDAAGRAAAAAAAEAVGALGRVGREGRRVAPGAAFAAAALAAAAAVAGAEPEAGATAAAAAAVVDDRAGDVARDAVRAVAGDEHVQRVEARVAADAGGRAAAAARVAVGPVGPGVVGADAAGVAARGRHGAARGAAAGRAAAVRAGIDVGVPRVVAVGPRAAAAAAVGGREIAERGPAALLADLVHGRAGAAGADHDGILAGLEVELGFEDFAARAAAAAAAGFAGVLVAAVGAAAGAAAAHDEDAGRAGPRQGERARGRRVGEGPHGVGAVLRHDGVRARGRLRVVAQRIEFERFGAGLRRVGRIDARHGHAVGAAPREAGRGDREARARRDGAARGQERNRGRRVGRVVRALDGDGERRGGGVVARDAVEIEARGALDDVREREADHLRRRAFRTADEVDAVAGERAGEIVERLVPVVRVGVRQVGVVDPDARVRAGRPPDDRLVEDDLRGRRGRVRRDPQDEAAVRVAAVAERIGRVAGTRLDRRFGEAGRRDLEVDELQRVAVRVVARVGVEAAVRDQQRMRAAEDEAPALREGEGDGVVVRPRGVRHPDLAVVDREDLRTGNHDPAAERELRAVGDDEPAPDLGAVVPAVDHPRAVLVAHVDLGAVGELQERVRPVEVEAAPVVANRPPPALHAGDDELGALGDVDRVLAQGIVGLGELQGGGFRRRLERHLRVLLQVEGGRPEHRHAAFDLVAARGDGHLVGAFGEHEVGARDRVAGLFVALHRAVGRPHRGVVPDAGAAVPRVGLVVAGPEVGLRGGVVAVPVRLARADPRDAAVGVGENPVEADLLVPVERVRDRERTGLRELHLDFRVRRGVAEGAGVVRPALVEAVRQVEQRPVVARAERLEVALHRHRALVERPGDAAARVEDLRRAGHHDVGRVVGRGRAARGVGHDDLPVVGRAGREAGRPERAGAGGSQRRRRGLGEAARAVADIEGGLVGPGAARDRERNLELVALRPVGRRGAERQERRAGVGDGRAPRDRPVGMHERDRGDLGGGPPPRHRGGIERRGGIRGGHLAEVGGGPA